MGLAHLLVLIAAAFPIALGVRVVPEAERFVVFRLGRFFRVFGPGLHWVLPGIDQITRVKLNRALPNWQSMSESDLQAELQRLAVSGQLSTTL